MVNNVKKTNKNKKTALLSLQEEGEWILLTFEFTYMQNA